MDGSFLEQIKKTKPKAFIFASVAFLGLVGPVVLEMFLVSPETYQNLSLPKIIFLAMSIILPMALVNIIMGLELTKKIEPRNKNAWEETIDICYGLFITAWVLYPNLIFQYFWGYTLHTFIIVALFIESAVVLSFIMLINNKKIIKSLSDKPEINN